MIAETLETGKDVGKKKAAGKAAQDEATRLVGVAEAAKQEFYSDLSNWCDLMATTLGKTTPAGKRMLAIRADLRGTGPRAPKPPTEPKP